MIKREQEEHGDGIQGKLRGQDQPQAQQKAPCGRGRGGTAEGRPRFEERDLCECVLQPAQPRRYRRGLRPDRRHGRALRGRDRGRHERQARAARLCGRAHPPRKLARQPEGVCQGRSSARHHDRYHRPARDRQRHGHRRHRVYAAGDRGPAARRALHAAELRARHPARRERREP